MQLNAALRQTVAGTAYYSVIIPGLFRYYSGIIPFSSEGGWQLEEQNIIKPSHKRTDYNKPIPKEQNKINISQKSRKMQTPPRRAEDDQTLSEEQNIIKTS